MVGWHGSMGIRDWKQGTLVLFCSLIRPAKISPLFSLVHKHTPGVLNLDTDKPLALQQESFSVNKVEFSRSHRWMPTTLLNPLPPNSVGSHLTLGPRKQGNTNRLAQHWTAGHPFIYSYWAGDFADNVNVILKRFNIVSKAHWKTED